MPSIVGDGVTYPGRCWCYHQQLCVCKYYIQGIIGDNTNKEQPTVGRLHFKCKIIAKNNKFRVIDNKIVIEQFKYDKAFAIMLAEKPQHAINNALKASDSKIKSLLTDMSKSITAKADSDF